MKTETNSNKYKAKQLKISNYKKDTQNQHALY